MLTVEIADANGGKKAQIRRRSDDDPQVKYPAGLMTYTSPYRQERNRPITARSDAGSTDMAINGSTAGGSPDSVHDGTDSTLWTGSNLTGTNFVFDSTAQAQAGTKSIDGTATVNNDQALLTRSSAINFTDYSAFTGFAYVDSWPIAGTKEVTFQFRLAGTLLGVPVNLSEYINTGTQNAWQSFTIPMTEFALTGTQIDELVITTVDIGGGQAPNYYLDTFVLASAAGGSPVTFVVEPRNGETMLVTGFVYNMVFPWDPTATVAGATENFVANQYLTYNKFAHLTELTNGLSVRRIQNDVAEFTNQVKNNWDLLKATNHVIDVFYSDGTNTMMKITTHFEAPVELRSSSNDRYEFIVNDDLSTLVHFEIRGRAMTISEALE